MKNLIDYIEECGEGCATPSNTIGMGNPMPPTEDHPGSEPVSAPDPKKEKKRKKKVNEGVFDTEENLDNSRKHIILNWFEKVGGKDQAKKEIQIDDNLEVTINSKFYIELDEPIPDYIRIKDIKGRGGLEIEIPDTDGDFIIPENFLPPSMDHLRIDRFNGSNTGNLVFKSKTISLKRCIIGGSIKSLILPKFFDCQDLDLSGCNDLQDVRNIQKVKSLNLPMSAVANMAKKLLKFNGPVRMNGWGPY